MILSEILFWISCLGILHSYLFYPRLLQWLDALLKRERPVQFSDADDWPVVTVLMSLYNEEQVIRQKMESLFNQDYPSGKIRFFIGSDASSDATNSIVEDMAAARENLRFFPYTSRQGKPQVINNLAEEAFKQEAAGPDHIILITDANVILESETISRLVRNFKETKIALVDSHMVNVGMKKQGISRSERFYINREVRIKYLEGLLWRSMVGPFGGCYALRSNFFVPIPAHFLVDDFFLTMRVFEQGGQAINDLEAICYEAVSHSISEEYKRKRRISAGNFQNLQRFFWLWFPPVYPRAFAIFSHKVLRWFGPFLILLALLSSGILAVGGNLFFTWLLVLQLALLLLAPLLDSLLSRMGLHWPLLRNVRYFIFMNFALLEGFFVFAKGIRQGIWEPPKRV